MQRITALGLLGLTGFLTPVAFSQGTSPPPQTRDQRLNEAVAEIALLKRMVRQQDRRIADLENALRTIQQAEGVAVVEGKVKVPPKPLSAPWQNPLAWTRVQVGISRSQVEELLGKPTSVDAVIDYQTLNYKGDVPGGRVLTGSVKLTDDRVTTVSPPVF